MTHRQFLVWHAWLRKEWDMPSRADHYAMQTAAEVRRTALKDKNSVQLNQFKIPFKWEKRKQGKEVKKSAEQARKEAGKAALKRSLARLGMTEADVQRI